MNKQGGISGMLVGVDINVIYMLKYIRWGGFGVVIKKIGGSVFLTRRI